MTTAPEIMDEYQRAAEGSYGDLGQRVADDVRMMAQLVRLYGAREDLDGHDEVRVRQSLDLCPAGRGHWTEFCTDGCGKLATISEEKA